MVLCKSFGQEWIRIGSAIVTQDPLVKMVLGSTSLLSPRKYLHQADRGALACARREILDKMFVTLHTDTIEIISSKGVCLKIRFSFSLSYA